MRREGPFAKPDDFSNDTQKSQNYGDPEELGQEADASSDGVQESQNLRKKRRTEASLAEADASGMGVQENTCTMASPPVIPQATVQQLAVDIQALLAMHKAMNRFPTTENRST